MAIRKRYAAGSACVVILAAIALYAMLGLPGLVDNMVLQRVWLDPDKVTSWGQNPGNSNTTTLRSYTFFNLTNPTAYLYHNQIPIFNEISGFLLQQRTNLTNLRYNQDQSVVNFSSWNYFTQLEGSRNLEEEVWALNLGPLGFWNQLQTSSIVWFAIQAYGGVYYELSISMKNQAIGQGLIKQYLKDYKALQNNLCSVMNLTSAGCEMLWSDPLYGLSDQNNYQFWVSWVLDGHLDDGITLVQYFGFTRLQILTFKRIFKPWCEGMKDIFENWYCDGRPCSSYDFMIQQMANGSITSNPPSGEPHQSICQTGNVTCSGWPQLFAFYKHVFLSEEREERFYNLTFPDQLVRNLFRPYSGVLLNVGNQSKLLQYGAIYQNSPQNQTNLALLRQTTTAESNQLAIVVYHYFKYFVYEFGMKYSRGGSRKQTGYAQTFVRYLYRSFEKVKEWIGREYVPMLAAAVMGECQPFIRKTIEEISQEKVKKICQGVRMEDYRSYYSLLQPCQNQLIGPELLSSRFNLTSYQSSQYCDPTSLSVLTILEQAHSALQSHYNCSANKIRPRCTNHQLTLMQFFNSTLSLHPLPSTFVNHTPSTTLHSHSAEMPAWEYRHFLAVVYNDSEYHRQELDYGQMADLLSFDKLMSNPMVQSIHLDKNETKFKELFYWDERELLKGWIRYYLIQVAFGGLIRKRKVRDLMFGYEDDFVRGIQTADLMRGGDPSRDTTISLNQPNKTQQEAEKDISSMYTGKDDPYRVRQFILKDQDPFIHYKRNSFDGYQIITQTLSPFKKWLPIKGTDGLQISPLSSPSQLQYIYIDPTKRISQMEMIEEFQRYGFDCRRYQLTQAAIASQSINPENEMFYQKFTGFINASFKGAPLFISGNHFLRTDKADAWDQRIDIYDQSGVNRQVASQYDRSELVVESKSGALFTGTTYLQTNLYCQPDLVFPKEVMLPIFTVYRSGNMSETAAEALLGQLKAGMKLPVVMLVVCIAIAVVVLLAMLWCYRREGKVKRINESLLESWERHSGSMVQQSQKHNQLQEREHQISLKQHSQQAQIQPSTAHKPNDESQTRLNPTLLESLA